VAWSVRPGRWRRLRPALKLEDLRMLHKLKSLAADRPALSVRSVSLGALRLAPWVVLGPITGVMSEAAIAAFRNRRPVLGACCVLLNIAVLVAIPALTAAILAYGASHRT
jgi:hypothetical protein